jgi:SAM-dependent methyltransferase
MVAGTCKICWNTYNNRLHQLKEMQLGVREMFTYLECGNCGLMQLQDIPDNLGKYYPNEGYYSFNLEMNIRKRADTLRRIKASYLIYGKNKLPGSLLSIGYRAPDYYWWMKNAVVQYNDAILDVGTGNGSLLMNLFKIGFTNLTGIDPFIDKEQQYGAINIYKKSIYEIAGQFDYIMLHHAFEHMDDPLKVLLRLKELLKPQKYILIRIPLMGMYGWKNFGLNWVGLDAPRHIIIHTQKSIEILAEKAGLQIQKIVFDSGPYHFWASEQYKNNIALMEPGSYMNKRQSHLFNKKKIAEYKKMADKTNREGMGDQAAFYLYKP